MPGVPIQDLWLDISPLRSQSTERTGYETQKPERLLERVIRLGSKDGELVMDCFVGSGTTAVVAEKLGRKWVACDLSRFAVHSTRKRLLDIPNVKPFVVQNLGKYERQVWQAAGVGGEAGGEGTQMGGGFRRGMGTGAGSPKTNGVDVLGWDFAFEMNEVAKQKAAEAGIDVKFLRIPHDVMDKRAREQGDVRFFELAALSVDAAVSGLALTLTLKDFVIPPDDVPEDVQRAITKWEQWIDYWAVDWDNKRNTFHNEWQDYRTRKKRDLQKSASHEYEQAGEYVVVVKVIDILGNDTTKTLKVSAGGWGRGGG